MKLLCNNCIHCTVCGFKDSYTATMGNIKTDIPAPFSLELHCPHYGSSLISLYNNIDCGTTSILNNGIDTYTSTISGSNTTSVTELNKRKPDLSPPPAI